MRKYFKILPEIQIYVKIAVLVILSLAVMELMNGGISRPRRSWKSGGTTVTFSQDGTLRVRPSWGVTVSFAIDQNTGLNRVPQVKGIGAMRDYALTAPPWRSVADSITNVIIEPGVTYIGIGIFSNEFLVLKSVTIPNTVTEIGAKAFMDCLGLESITIPENVNKIGVGAFPGWHNVGYLIWSGMHSITSLNPAPPEMDVQYVCVETILYVPDGSVDAYSTADGWNGFKHIKPIHGETSDVPSLKRMERDCFCRGIGGNRSDKYRQEESVWIGHLTRLLMFYGIASWLYILLGFILKKCQRDEHKKTKILSIIFAPILWFFGVLLGDFFTPVKTGQCETSHWPYYDHLGAITYGCLYLAAAALFYQVFRKRIRRQATIIILTTLHIVIFASLMIGGGL